MQYALQEKANNGSLFVVDKIQIESGKTKDAYAMFKALNQRNVLLISEIFDEKTFLAFRNIKDCYLIDSVELNAYLVATFRSIVIEKSLLNPLLKRIENGKYYRYKINYVYRKIFKITRTKCFSGANFSKNK